MRPQRFVCVLLLSLSMACAKKAVPQPPSEEMVVTVDPEPELSWVGLKIGYIYVHASEEIRAPDEVVSVLGVLPTTPAEGIFRYADIIESVAGTAVKNLEDFSDTVRSWPADVPIEVAVKRDGRALTLKVVPEIRPTQHELMRRMFEGRRMPTAIKVSVADVDASGIVEGTQCVVGPESSCPRLGLHTPRDLVAGSQRLMVIWSQFRKDHAEILGGIKAFQDRHHVAVTFWTGDSPQGLARFFHRTANASAYPRMTLASHIVSDGKDGPYLEELREGTVLLLDQKGIVQAVSDASTKGLDEIAARLPHLAAPH